ncbi:unnamed protein product [Protopolystoma xenopodis]|uniref:Uncharacterized protein n=1 Tax=Protopolystoma xenopodis TaxID=117903 RepID=A0A3S5A4M7_9PLAT|nr:unnamed protein product [Protopolystoma xenopodis]
MEEKNYTTSRSSNNMDYKVKFTIDFKENGRLPFLDVEVIRSEETLKKKLFRKKSHAGITLDFQSNNTYGMKI